MKIDVSCLPVDLTTAIIRKEISGDDDKLTVIDFFRNSKIRNLDASLVVDEDIGAFDITMDDISLVEIDQTRQRLSHEFLDEAFFKRAIIL